ncbi:MAG: cyclopropane-fatty-acyl-phospholipid synthase [Gammaproteobacteria bacterium]|nr:cyclopropane-fatty-acyl-phospholipid synthase [Gammaproteobacteria bacterium]
MKTDQIVNKVVEDTLLSDSKFHRSSITVELARRSIFAFLNSIEGGSLRLEEPNASYLFGNSSSEDGIHAMVVVKNKKMYRMVMLNTSIGAGEAFMEGYWTSPDLTAVIRLLCRNLAKFRRLGGLVSSLVRSMERYRHRLAANTPTGSRRNIRAHYDLGNEFFATFLDKHMMYSSAIFSESSLDLDTASKHKLQKIGGHLELTENDHVLEIGTGWGGLAVYFAENYSCKVTTTTISAEQYSYTCELVKKKGLDQYITVLNQDYRELAGQFDKLVSVEMIEAVGHNYLQKYLNKCNELLVPKGKFLLQAIVIPEQRYQAARNGVDFIQRYIFPGGGLPSLESILKSAGKNTQLQMKYLEDIGADYAETLRHWRHRFLSNSERITAMGFDDRFMRMWQFYLAYCEGGFDEDAISATQILLVKV